MAKSLGSSKTGGRKKGTPNKRTLAFGEALESQGVDLLGEILKTSKGLSEADRLHVYIGLLPYQYPKRKPIENAPFSIEDYLVGLSKREAQILWTKLSGLLGYNLQPSEMSIEQLQDFRSTLDNIIALKKSEDELGEIDDVTC